MSLEFGSGQNCGRTYQGLARVRKGTIPTIATASEQCQTLAGLDESINTPDIFATGFGETEAICYPARNGLPLDSLAVCLRQKR